MRIRRQPGGVRAGRLGAAAALLTTVALVAGCGGTTPSAAPTVVPSPAGIASTQPSPTQAAATPSPSPSSTPGAVTGRWEQAGTMAIAHQDAVLLGDGRVLVVGNDCPDVCDNTTMAELWDPATGTWRTTESLPSPRADFATVALKGGRVLITGGRNPNDQSFSSAYVYDPRPGNESWTKVGLMAAARTAPIAAVLADGRVLVAGGYFRTKPSFGDAGPGAVLAAYRPDSPRVTGSPRARLADVAPPNVGSALATAELFDPGTGTWSATGPMKFARFGAGAVTLADGRVLVVGSGGSGGGVSRVDARAFDSAEIYDPKTGRFSLVAGRLPAINRSALQKQGAPHANPVPTEDPVVGGGSLVALKDGGAVLIAQSGSWKHEGDITRSFRFDARTGAWTEIGRTFIDVYNPDTTQLVTPGVPSLAGATVAGLPGGQVLVAGGAGETVPPYSNTYTSASAQLYDPATNIWSPLPPMPEARAGAAAVVLRDGSVLLAGGSDYRPPGDQVGLTSAIRFVP